MIIMKYLRTYFKYFINTNNKPCKQGFSLVEIMATVTLIAIVTLVTAPSYLNTQRRDTFRAGTQAFFDYMIMARNAAMTNKKCTGGFTSTSWRVDLILNDDTGTDYTTQLKCVHSGGETDETELKTLLHGDVYFMEFEKTGGSGAPYSKVLRFSFYSTSGLPRIEHGPDSSNLTRVNDIKIVFKFDYQDHFQTVCFNRIAGYPTLKKSGQDCNDY